MQGGFSFADGVNASGTIVSTAFRRDGLGRAVVWKNGHAYGLGVVGKYDESFAQGEQHATTWGPHQRRGTDLGVLRGGSFASLLALDGYGRAAGGGDTGATPGTTHAIVWPGHGPLLTLRPLSGHTASDFSVGREFRSNGDLVGGSLTAAGEIHGTVWVCPFRQAIPLPSGSGSSSAAATGAAGRDAVPARVSRGLADARPTQD